MQPTNGSKLVVKRHRPFALTLGGCCRKVYLGDLNAAAWHGPRYKAAEALHLKRKLSQILAAQSQSTSTTDATAVAPAGTVLGEPPATTAVVSVPTTGTSSSLPRDRARPIVSTASSNEVGGSPPSVDATSHRPFGLGTTHDTLSSWDGTLFSSSDSEDTDDEAQQSASSLDTPDRVLTTGSAQGARTQALPAISPAGESTSASTVSSAVFVAQIEEPRTLVANTGFAGPSTQVTADWIGSAPAAVVQTAGSPLSSTQASSESGSAAPAAAPLSRTVLPTDGPELTPSMARSTGGSSTKHKKTAKGAKQAQAEQAKRGLDIPAAALSVALGLAVRFLCPLPQGITPQSWTLLGVFVSCVAGLIFEPLPAGAWSLCCVSVLLLTKTVTFAQALAGTTNDTIFLIVCSFFFARGFEKTGLGERVANYFVALFGRTTLGVAYALVAAEALLAPAMPSSTARAGGIFMPIVKLMSRNARSEPEPEARRKRLGAYLTHTQLQASAVTASLFLTGAAQNLLSMKIAASMGVVVPNVWLSWFTGAVVPVLVSLAMIPLLTFMLIPPGLKQNNAAPQSARERLHKMGPLSRNELIMSGTLASALCLWMFGEVLGVSAVLTAMSALCVLLLTGVLTWSDCLSFGSAWDTLLWFSVLVGMCDGLVAGGVVQHISSLVSAALSQLNLHWLAAMALLHGIYFYSHYLFASQVGHVGALYGAFLTMMLAAGVPAKMAALTLGYNAALFGGLTHYASGQAAVYYGTGYMALPEVMGIGALMAARSLLVFGTVGLAWWKFLGWW